LELCNVQYDQLGIYDLVVSNNYGRVVTTPTIVGLPSVRTAIGHGQVVGLGILHPNGNVLDQVLMSGGGVVVAADVNAGKVIRTSFIDANDDIVQVEFSGPGSLAIVLDPVGIQARPSHYNQDVLYVKGHAGLVIVGADERTNVAVFSVGRATAYDPTGNYNILQPPSPTNDPANNGSPLFAGHAATDYDGVADVGYLAITSTNGKFGGVRTANARYFATRGIAGIYAPGVTLTGPLFVGDITAFESATPMLVTGSATDVRIAGGALRQENGAAIQTKGLTRLQFVAGSTSHGGTLPAQANEGVLQEDGTEVTSLIVVDPP
jgi:hypothetical protein